MKIENKIKYIPINNFFQYYVLTYPYNILYKPNINENNINKNKYNKLLHELKCYFLLYSKQSITNYIFPYKYNFKIIVLLHNHNSNFKISDLLNIYKNNPLNNILSRDFKFNIKLCNILSLYSLNINNKKVISNNTENNISISNTPNNI